MTDKSGYTASSRALRRQQQLRPRGFLRSLWSRRLVRWALILYVLGSLVAGAVWIYFLPQLKITRITIEGTPNLNTQIMEIVEPVKGEPIMGLDLGPIVEDIRQLSLVKEVMVRKQPPNELYIQVREREPRAIWQAGEVGYVVDNSGTVIYEQTSGSSLIAINDVSGTGFEVGQKVDLEALLLADILQQLLPEAMGTESVSFEYVSNGGLVAIIDGGFRGRYGDSTDIMFKTAVWKVVLEKAEEVGLTANHTDLRFGYRPFFRA